MLLLRGTSRSGAAKPKRHMLPTGPGHTRARCEMSSAALCALCASAVKFLQKPRFV